MKEITDKLGLARSHAKLAWLMFFTMIISGLVSILLSSLLPELQSDNHLNYTQSGNLLSAHYVGNLSALILAGILPRSTGRKFSVMILGSGLIFGYVIMMLTASPLWLMVCFGAVGMSRGAWSNISNTVIGEISTHRVAALNVLHACFAVGALLSPVVLLVCSRIFGLGWRAAAAFAALLGVAVFLLTGLSALSKKPERPQVASGRPSVFLRSPAFWLSTAILFFYIGTEASITGWLVSYFQQAGKLAPEAVVFTPTILWATMLAGRLACAALARRIQRSVMLLGTGILSTLFFISMLVAPSPLLVIVSLLFLGLCLAGIAPTTITSFHAYSSTLATGLGMGIGTVGGVLLPTVVGAVADRVGLSGGVAMILTFCVAMIIFMIADLAYSLRLRKITGKK